MSDYEPMSDAEWLRKELLVARAERDALRELLKEVLDNPDEIWGELSARIDAALNKEPK